ncbi:MAG: FHA domain-containing protein, partial [Polyangiaceae bacterium]
MAWLRVLVRDAAHRRPYDYTTKRTVTVGRDAHANVVLGTPGVSTYHLLFEREKGSDDWDVRDRGSKNGTLVGGRALPPGQPIRVPPRCWMQIGATGLEVFGRRPLQR